LSFDALKRIMDNHWVDMIFNKIFIPN